jgi:hypothetical protein
MTLRADASGNPREYVKNKASEVKKLSFEVRGVHGIEAT